MLTEWYIHFLQLKNKFFLAQESEFCVTMDTNTTDVTSLGNNGIAGNLTEDLSNFMEKVEEYMAFKVALLINYYWSPILIPIGLIGNTLSFLVMIKQTIGKYQLVFTWQL